MEKFYKLFTILSAVILSVLLSGFSASAQAPFTVNGVVSNTSCYGLTNGAINLTVTGAGGGPSTGTFCNPTVGSAPCNCPTTWDHINNFYTTGGVTNISALETDCTNPGANQLGTNYFFYPSQIVTVNPGDVFGFGVQCGNNTTGCSNQFSQGFRIWVDWNNDGDLTDAGEEVWNSGSAGFQMFTGSITVPPSTPCGAKRMRVRSSYAGLPPAGDPCGYSGYGETEEYTVQVCTPASFSWSNGATTEDISNLPAGTYTVTVTAGTNSSVVTFTVNQPSQVITNITAAGNDTLLCPGETTVLTATGQPTWTYTWSNAVTGNSITVSQPAVYTVTVSNSNGCSATDQITVLTALASNPPVITPADTTLVCQGNSVTLSVTPSGNITWQPNGETTPTINADQSGSYYVTYTDASGCTGQSLAVTVLVVPPPVASIAAGGPTTFCEGGSVTLTSNYTSGNMWSNGSTASSITVSSAGVYGLTVSISGCSDAAAPVNVVVNPLPAPQITPNGPLSFCEGGSVQLSSNFASGNMWSTSSTQQQISATSSGSFSLTVTDNNGCSASTALVNVTVNPAPPIPVITTSGSTSICSGSSVTLTSSASSGNQWSNNQSTSSISVSTGGSYSVTVMDANGCTSSSSPVQVSVNPVPTAEFMVPPTVCIADGATVTYSGTGTQGATYDWDFGNATVVNGSGMGPYTLSFSAAGPYVISLQVTETTGCASEIITHTIQVNESPSATFTTNAYGICEGNDLVVAYTGSAPATANYSWNFDGGVIVSGSGQGPYVISYNMPYTAEITLTVTQGSCLSDVFSVPVEIHGLPDANFAASQTLGCDSLTVDFFSSANNASHVWHFGDGTQSSGNVTSHFYTSGIYTVSMTVTDSNGCTNAFTDTSLVQIYPTPAASFVTTPELRDTLNMDEAVILFQNQSEQSNAYDWNFGDGVSTSEYSPVHAYHRSGLYTVQLIAMNQAGCADTATSEPFVVLPGADTFVPNSFSPNGDGKNDVLKMFSHRYREAYFSVYDRIGQKMFETHNIEQGWDGRMKGNPCNHGVYVYYGRVVYLNGVVKEYWGDVTLFR